VRTLLYLALATFSAGCSGEPSEPKPLVDHNLWVSVGASDDPFDDRPVEVDCSPLAFGYDFIGEDSMEVDMGGCDYLTVSQASLADVERSDSLYFRLWHNGLVGPEGESHVAVTLDGELVWDLRIPIPGESQLITETIESDVAASSGSEVLFHLHNHGSNTYNFLEFTVIGG
jgi:hypothetical protein